MSKQIVSLEELEVKVEVINDRINNLRELISAKEAQLVKTVNARTKMNVLTHDKSLSNLQVESIENEISKIDELSDNCLSKIASLEAEKTSHLFDVNDAEAALCQFISTYGHDYSITIAV